MKYKTCWISDLHLGSKKAQVQPIYDFLKENEFETLYLVGDVIDIWRWQQVGLLSRGNAQQHINIIQRLLKLSKKGTKIYYILGNHDEFLEHFIKDDISEFGNISIASSIVHTTAKNQKYMVIHGHQFDLITRTSPWLAKFGDRGYEILIKVNHFVNYCRKKLGFKYWSLSKYIKVKVKKAVNFTNNFEIAAVNYAIEKDCNGIIVGHIHSPDDKIMNGIHYLNTGCWTDITNCSALIENIDGNIELLYFKGQHNVSINSGN